MIVPILKGIDFIGKPENSNQFKVRATAYISEENDQGADCFHFQVVSVEYLKEYLSQANIFDGRATFIVIEFDEVALESEIKRMLKDCIRNTWDEVATAINRHLRWEYDNIQYLSSDSIKKKLEIN